MDDKMLLEFALKGMGYAITYSKAADLISRSQATIKNMLEDGRLQYACDGTRVDTRSLVDYVCNRSARDCEARIRKRHPTQKYHV